jgi:hypothetical protein
MLSKLVLLLILPGTGALAQSASVAVSTPAKVTVYLSADGSPLPQEAGSHHKGVITLRDSVSGLLREYYPSGKLWKFVPLAHVREHLRHGSELTYDEAGTLRRRQTFIGGKRHGKAQLYRADGSLANEIDYVQNLATDHRCFDTTSQPLTCSGEKLLPQFPGGTLGVVNAIRRATVLPASYLSKAGWGLVTLKFVVGTDAAINGGVVIGASSPELVQPALAALAKIEPFKAAGTIDQIPVQVVYTVALRVGPKVSDLVAVHEGSGTGEFSKVEFLELE